MECIVDPTRTYGQVQALVDGQRWTAQSHSRGVTCTHCGSATEIACYADASADATYCLKCVFANAVIPRRTRQDGDQTAAIGARGAVS